MSTVPIFSPDGSLGDVPYDQLHAALAAGAKPGVTIKSPDGKLGVVPADRYQEAAKAGATIVPFHEQETQHPGFWSSVAEDALSIPKGILASLPPVQAYNALVHTKDEYESLTKTGKTTEQMADEQRQQAGHGLAYRALAPGAAQAVGVNLPGMEQAAEQGDMAGVLGHTVVPAAMGAAPIVGEGVGRVAGAAARKVSPKLAAQVAGGVGGAVAGHGALSVPGAYYGAKTAGELAEAMLGKERAGRGIISDPPAPTYRDATVQSERNVPEFAGDEIEDAPQATAPRYRDATRQNEEFAGEEIEDAKPAPASTSAPAPEATPEFWAGTKSVGGRQSDLFAKAKAELFPGKTDLSNGEIAQVNKRTNELSAAPSPLDQARAELGPDAPLSKVVERSQELKAAPAAAANAASTIPRTLSGESALRQVLTGQDNANLLKIARSRGINITKESQLRPGFADNLLVNKIINDFSEGELSNVRDTFLESKRNRAQFGDIGPEAWKTMSLQTYFPELKISAAQLKRVQAAIAAGKKLPAGVSADDLTDLLQQSVDQVKKR